MKLLKGIGLFFLCFIAATFVSIGIQMLFPAVDNGIFTAVLTLIFTFIFLFYTQYETRKINKAKSNKAAGTIDENPFKRKSYLIVSTVLNVILLLMIASVFTQYKNTKDKYLEVNTEMEDVTEEMEYLEEQHESVSDQYVSLEEEYNALLAENVSEDAEVVAAEQEEIAPEEDTEFVNPEGAFTQGSSKEHVRAVMGAPTGISSYPTGREMWSYDFATVTFNAEGVVEGWSDYGGDTLKVQ
ncbi:hypothetical protein ACFQ4X_07025 [Fictibacillus halophilus]|uniref:hypothetical protein n=1 Tax=Fictibacillus halophilus TaxID=1610490 RepID=UPI00363711CF